MAYSKTTHKQKTDIYELVTDTIIARLEQGFIPWKKPWASIGPAQNLVTKNPYRGINALMLNGIYISPYFLTFNQVKSLGGQVIKGSNSLPVVFWKRYYTDMKTGKKISEEEARKLSPESIKVQSFLRYYRVFNARQISGIQFPEISFTQPSEVKKIQKCEETVHNMPMKPKIEHFGDKACYNPISDAVTIPDINSFYVTEEYYQTLFHELGHSTGHTSRIGREGIMETHKFGSDDYGFEELIAEFTASFVSNALGLEHEPTLENSAAYIQNWIEKLKSDKTLLIKASSQAQKAADWILNLS